MHSLVATEAICATIQDPSTAASTAVAWAANAQKALHELHTKLVWEHLLEFTLCAESGRPFSIQIPLPKHNAVRNWCKSSSVSKAVVNLGHEHSAIPGQEKGQVFVKTQHVQRKLWVMLLLVAGGEVSRPQHQRACGLVLECCGLPPISPPSVLTPVAHSFSSRAQDLWPLSIVVPCAIAPQARRSVSGL
jgi:hypothetical protein